MVVLGLVGRVRELDLDLEAGASSVVWAVALSRLITSGTVCVVGPLDTFSVTLACGPRRVAGRVLVDDDVGGLVGLDVDPADGEAGSLQLGGGRS